MNLVFYRTTDVFEAEERFQEHGIDVTCDGATIEYSENGTDYSEVNPKYKDAGEYRVYYKVVRENTEHSHAESSHKRACDSSLSALVVLINETCRYYERTAEYKI